MTDSKLEFKQEHVKVGVGALVFRKDEDGKLRVLLGQRKGSHGAGKYALPGGHLELGESWQDCASRELDEECNLKFEKSKWKFAFVSNDVMPEDQRHYITIFVQYFDEDAKQEVKNMEPNKCEKWEWRVYEDLKDSLKPESLFVPLKHLIDSNFTPLAPADDRAFMGV
eukprot:CAMPEP_0197532900 /NCGR_PEP_ID=MMETSP1318-20131121/41366_1 /TAXON_ID=552666 /ORGANISM="Partenskyella glossopodia, Strain RCC365" /LENGTH=167 /DNA_ID=CAMNT_0043089597 /DNA_START=79 /DNA_END=582 /DNA_ORIENTATION=+